MAILRIPVGDLPLGGMKLGRAGTHRVLLVRTAGGVHALDHACPHQGYGLAQGEVDPGRGVLTCAWHNWKFRLEDGACVLGGGEGVRTHRVVLDGDDAIVEVHEPTPEEQRAELLPSLRAGLAEDRTGRIARDVVRLLRAFADPAELVWTGVAFGADRAEYGWGHGLAAAADAVEVLATGELDGDERAYPVVQALAGIADDERFRPVRPRPAPSTEIPAEPDKAFRTLVEHEDVAGAEALVLGALDAGFTAEELRPWFVGAVSDHHLSFGHLAIYTQKAYSLLDHLGHDRAGAVLPGLAHAAVIATREDLLPYFRAPAAQVRAADVWALAAAPDRRRTGWVDEDRALRRAILDDPAPPVAAAVRAVVDGAGVEGLLDTVVLAGSERLLRYDLREERAASDFGWLDITHVLTYANAARWAWRAEPGPDAARLALWTVLLAHDSGRADRRWGVTATPAFEPPGDGGRALEQEVHRVDLAGSTIVQQHLIKTVRAARKEASEVGDPLPLAGAARFVASPKLDRFVGVAVEEAIHLARKGTPLPR